MDLGHHTEFLSQMKKSKDSEAGQWNYRLVQLSSQSGKETKLMKSLGVLIAFFLELSYQGFGAGKPTTFPYHAFPRICSWLYKMTYRSVHGCNEVFGVQDYHIADTGWLRRDRKSAMCCLFFFMKSLLIIMFIALLGLPGASQRLD